MALSERYVGTIQRRKTLKRRGAFKKEFNNAQKIRLLIFRDQFPFFVFPIYRALTRVAFAFFAEQRALWWCIEFRSFENRRRRRRRRPFLAVRFALDD